MAAEINKVIASFTELLESLIDQQGWFVSHYCTSSERLMVGGELGWKKNMVYGRQRRNYKRNCIPSRFTSFILITIEN